MVNKKIGQKRKLPRATPSPDKQAFNEGILADKVHLVLAMGNHLLIQNPCKETLSVSKLAKLTFCSALHTDQLLMLTIKLQLVKFVKSFGLRKKSHYTVCIITYTQVNIE